MALSNETILGRRYALRARIAVGGMGEVWRAEDTLLHRIVAVKVLKSELSSDPSFIDRFRAEATTTAALSHPGIAGIFDYGEVRSGDEPPVAYLVMELVRGEPLSAILAAEGRLPVARTLGIVGQVATALQVAHAKGMVHRDIKPGNVIVSPDGAVKVTDFGIARVAYAVPLTEHGMVVGTAQYFSPEQAQGEVVATASDIYSLGVVAYECLAGRLPFVAENPLTVALMQIRDEPPPLPADVSPAARTLVMRCLAKSPRQRYQTGGELAGAVRVAQTDPNAALRRAAE
ncbi:MAG: protein kinase domain-containing protein, partial [Mycobacteriales bacterium]